MDEKTMVNDILGSVKADLTAYQTASFMKWSMRGKCWEDFPITQRWFAVGETMAHLDYLMAIHVVEKIEGNVNQYRLLYSAEKCKSKIDLSLLLDQLIDESYPMLQEKELTIKAHKKASIPYMGDGTLLARAFSNIIKNAINYSYAKSEINISINSDKEKIVISFKNKGDKIPSYKLEKLFEKFYRVDESRTTKTGGSGLGLSITKEIIELHNGKIAVNNDDEYIEFLIELPNK